MKIHIIGICGIGMSAIAQILSSMGYSVQGSDTQANSFMLNKLESAGIKVIPNHFEENIKDVDLVIKSTAIKDNNSEIIAAKTSNKKIFTRAQAIKILLEGKRVVTVSGAHGKSTSTAMTHSILSSASLHPSLICGAIVKSISNNAKLGRSNIFVLESDESDGSFSKICYQFGALTNIDFEHIDYYGTFENLISHYRIFIRNVLPAGIVAICKDDKRLFNVADSMHDKSHIIYYSIDQNADIRAINISLGPFGSIFDIEFSGRFANFKSIKNIEVNLPGLHNIYNALAAISLSIKFGVSAQDIKSGFRDFAGLERRFTILGTVKGAMIVDDYAHHPTEIIATIEAAKKIGRVICIIQPHRFSRVRSLFDEYVNIFDKVNYTFLLNVYPAGEEPIENYTSADIINAANAKGMLNVQLVTDETILNTKILEHISSGDVVVFLGAGSITNLANNFFANAKSM